MGSPGLKQSKFFYGWVIVAVGALAIGAAAATAPPVFTQFAVPMTEELGWSRTMFAGAFSLGTIGIVILSPVAGRLVDRYGARLVLAGGGLVLGGALVFLGLGAGVASFYVGYGLARGVALGVIGMGATIAVANWFIVKRGRTMAIINVGRGLGASAMPMLSFSIIQTLGWRTAWMALGLLVWAIVVVPAAVFLRRRPEDMGLKPDGARSLPKEPVDGSKDGLPSPSSGPSQVSPVPANPSSKTTTKDEIHWTLGQAAKTPALWLLTMAMFFRGLDAPAIGIHLAPYLQDRGIELAVAAVVISLEAVFIALGGLLWGLLAERFNIRYCFAITLASNALAVVLLLRVDSVPMAFAYAITYGTGLGGIFTLEAVNFADYFGRNFLGSIRGFVLPFQTVGAAIGPLVSGLFYDVTGHYEGAFTIFAFGFGLSAFLAFMARRPTRERKAVIA